MKRIQDGIELVFPPGEKETAEIIDATCKRSIALIREVWGLTPPKRCRVYVMTSALEFIFGSAPWYARILYGLSFPFWYFRVQKVWKLSGGWTLQHRGCPTIGIKPPRLVAQADKSVGEMIFIKETDVNRKTEHIACHELTHAFSAHLKLPLWINEGIAMVTVDKFFGQSTVKSETLNSLYPTKKKPRTGEYRYLPEMRKEDIVYHYVRGYWITRLLMDTHPGILQEVLKKKQRHWAIERAVSTALGIKHRNFWKEIDGKIIEYFGNNSQHSQLNQVITRETL